MVKFYSLGQCPPDELLLKVGARTGTMTMIDQIVVRLAALDPDLVRALGDDCSPPRPDLRIVGGRDG